MPECIPGRRRLNTEPAALLMCCFCLFFKLLEPSGELHESFFNTVIISNRNFPVTQQVKINRKTKKHDNGPTTEVISDKNQRLYDLRLTVLLAV